MKWVRLVYRFCLLMSREVFYAFLLSFAVAAILGHLNPRTYKVVGLLVPIGILSGFLKGFTKLMLFNLKTPTLVREYFQSYPKYKFLAGYLGAFLVAMTYSFGFHPLNWFQNAVTLLADNVLLNTMDYGFWFYFCVFFIILGVVSHILNPIFTKEECQPLDKPSEKEDPEIVVSES